MGAEAVSFLYEIILAYSLAFHLDVSIQLSLNYNYANITYTPALEYIFLISSLWNYFVFPIFFLFVLFGLYL